jgi:hypothetical protein
MAWSDDFPGMLKRCTLTNYSSVAVFRVSVILSVEWLEAVGNASGTYAGKVIRSGEAPSPSFDLGVGAKNEDYFYIANMTDLYIRLKIPEVAKILIFGMKSS